MAAKWLPTPNPGGYFIPSIKPVAWFHAYVMCGVIGLSRGKTSASTYYHRGMNEVLREYLVYACGDDEWTKGRILEAMRFKTQTAIKVDARHAFPSLFPRNRKARPLDVPEELKDETVNFDIERVKQWRDRVKAIKKEIIMNENAIAQEAEVADQSSATEGGSNSRVTVNFFIPEGVFPANLTLDNYRELTGKRFRMTKDQAVVRSLTRADAFVESKALAVSQLGGK